jgi:iron complex outermembrane receptor protein
VPSATVYRLPTAGYALHHLDLGAGRLRVAGQDVEVGLSIQNVFDTTYRDYLSRYRLFVDDPGRTVVVRLRTGFGGLALD